MSSSVFRISLLLSVPFVLSASLGSCGEASVPLDQERRAAEAIVDEHAGHDHPPGAHPTPAPEAVRFEGVVRLTGALADHEEGFVFVSVKPKGVRMPCYSRKYSLADSEVEGGERLLRFELDEGDSLGGLVPGELVFEARFDPDGVVETREGTAFATVATGPGELGIEVVLAEE